MNPLPGAAVAYAPQPASAQPAPSPVPATASSAPATQSSGADACAVAVSITQPDPETRLRSVAVQSVFAALPCALATPTTAAASAPAPLLPPTPAAPRQTLDAHNIATTARARRYPALPPAHPHALKIRPYAATPALPLPSPCPATRAPQTAPAPAAALISWKHTLLHVRRSLHHAPCVAAQAQPTSLAQISHQKVLAAHFTPKPRKTVRQKGSSERCGNA